MDSLTATPLSVTTGGHMMDNKTAKVTKLNAGGAVPFTQFYSHKANTKTEESLSWPELIERMQEPKEFRNKKACHWIKLATFGEKRSDADSLRTDANMLSVTGAEGDYDGEVMPPEEAVERLTEAGIECAVYTSASHKEAAPRWRVIAPFSAPYSASEDEMRDYRKDMVHRIEKALGIPLNSESYVLSQSYYWGKVRDTDYKAFHIKGKFIDQASWVDDRNLPVDMGKSLIEIGEYAPVDFAACAKAIAEGGNYHEPLRSLSASLANDGVTNPEVVIGMLRGLLEAGVGGGDGRWQERWEAIPRLVKSAFAKFHQQGEKAETLPELSELGFTILDAEKAPLHPTELVNKHLFADVRVFAGGGWSGQDDLNDAGGALWCPGAAFIRPARVGRNSPVQDAHHHR